MVVFIIWKMKRGNNVRKFRILRKNSLFANQIICFAIVSILPIVIIGYFYYNERMNLIDDYYIRPSREYLQQSELTVETMLETVNALSLSVLFDVDLNEMLRSKPQSIRESVVNTKQIRDKLIASKFVSSHVSTISVVTEHYSVSSTEDYVDYNSLHKKDWLVDFENSEKQKAYSGVYYNDYLSRINIPVFALLRKINNPITGEVIGTLIVEIKYSSLDEIFRHKDYQTDNVLILYNTNKQIIYTPNFDTVMNPSETTLSIIDNLSHEEENLDYANHDYIYLSQKIENTDWTIANIIFVTDLLAENKGVLISMVILMSCVLITVILVSYVISRYIYRPIDTMYKCMEKVEQGDLSIQVPCYENKEMAVLSRGFNRMLDKINQLIADIQINETKRSKAEMMALQAQINPHFLYNTLGTIKWLAAIQGSHSINKIVTALIKLLEYNSNMTGELVPISKEIENIQHYSQLMAIRYDDRFTMKYEIDKDIDHYGTIRLILQPLVENAIFHGMECKEGGGTILLKISSVGDSLLFQIADDGVGMSIDNPENHNFSGLGTSNVNTRLTMRFGEASSLKLQSELGVGTTVSFSIPKVPLSL